MTEPRLHHYVPRFYLMYFCREGARFWVWDKKSGRIFRTSPNNVAAETHFYRIPEFIGTDVDPLFLEKDLAAIETKGAAVLHQCVSLLDATEPLSELQMDDDERWALSLFLAVQFLRTAEQREILGLFALGCSSYKDGLSHNERINLHAHMLCSGGLVEAISNRIYDSIWIYGRNLSTTPFWTSDNPVCFKTCDNRMWLKGPGILSHGSYVVFPITPTYVLYCKERQFWRKLASMESRLSPVEFSSEMVRHENSGQIFMATRHVVSPVNEFKWADEFVESIGTDTYAPCDDS